MDASLWKDMFLLGVPVLEKILRPIIVYLFLIIGLRLSGKRELAQLNPFDFVVLLTLSNTVQNAIIGNDNSVSGGILGASTLLLVNYLVVRFLYRHNRLDELVEGRSTVIVQDGVLQKDSLRQELITLKELIEAARKQGFASLDEVDYADLEPGGGFSFIGKRPAPEIERHSELLSHLEQLTQQLTEMQAQVEKMGQARPPASGS
jgi:uncharacterized membrane protein YcaP (DUF421 family)